THPDGPGPGRRARRQPAATAGLRRAAPPGRPSPRPRKTGADARRHRPGPRAYLRLSSLWCGTLLPLYNRTRRRRRPIGRERAMMKPQRAPVRPRVICPDSGEELPLEEVVRSFLEAGLNRTILLRADPDSTTAALRHLAFVFAGTPEVRVGHGLIPKVTIRCKTGSH